MSERVVLITGASRGTGAGTARVLAAEGATVLVHGFVAAPTEQVVTDIRSRGGRAEPVVGDICTDDGADAVAEAVRSLGLDVDVLINNYGVAEGAGWFDDTAQSWHEQFDKNVVSAFRMVQRFVPGMRERGWGRVVFLSTIGATRPRANLPAYYSAKTALPGTTVSLMKELSGTGVTVNTVSPGIIATAEVVAMYRERAERRGEPTDWASLQRLMIESMPNPTGRVPTTEDIGRVIAFVVSDAGWHLNGLHLRVDGGAVDCVT
ncbi:MAG TPA: SDR family NAD(P)-dependent oxidoreductase [Acidimicrobiales bacterium]|nr:SDR family NAD(P)-dependent oxidoreductase [Acidimicrobiales bacterium]